MVKLLLFIFFFLTFFSHILLLSVIHTPESQKALPEIEIQVKTLTLIK